MRDRSLGHPLGDTAHVIRDVRLPGMELVASQLQGFGVTPSRTPLQCGTHRCTDSDACSGFISVLWLVQCAGGGWGQSHAVTSLVLKALSRDVLFLRRSVPRRMITLDVAFRWDPRSSSSRKALALPEASSENKGKGC